MTMFRSLCVALFIFFAGPLLAQQVQIITTPPTGTVQGGGQLLGGSGQIIDVNAKPSGPVCGGAGQPRCGSKVATFQSYGLTECPQGSFFDLLRWSCWTCPAGHNRTVDAVDSATACEISDASVRGEFIAARRAGGQCPPGSFFDSIRGGECWSCPGGYQRTAAHVEWADACIAPQAFSGAQRWNRGLIQNCNTPNSNFFDIYDGGGCWGCPAGYVRTVHHVAQGQACERPRQVAHATLVKKSGCGPGEIFDLYDNGTCWTCPDQYRRTVFPVYGNQACERGGGKRLARATQVATAPTQCPSGQIYDASIPNLDTIKRLIAKASAAGDRDQALRLSRTPKVATGSCWSCPPGHQRTTAAVWDDGACAAQGFEWYTKPYTEPGLFGLAGADRVLIEATRNHPKLVQESIAQAAVAAAKASKQPLRQQHLVDQRNLFLKSPGESDAAAAVVLVRMLSAVAHPETATEAEKTLVESFRRYIIARRTYSAQDALNAYYSWKKADEYWKHKGKEGLPPNLLMMIDMGTVPPDFSYLATIGALGTGVGAMVVSTAAGKIPLAGKVPFFGDVVSFAFTNAVNGFASFRDPVTASTTVGRAVAEALIAKAAELAVKKLAQAAVDKLVVATIGKAAGAAASGSVSALSTAGPQVVIGAAMMIISIALDRVIQIEEAEGRLKASVATAQQPPDLKRLTATEEGTVEVLTMWSQALTGNVQTPSMAMQDFPAVATAALSRIAPGSVVRTFDNQTVYLVSKDGVRGGISTMPVFTACGLSQDAVQFLPSNEIGALQQGAVINDAELCKRVRNGGAIQVASAAPASQPVATAGPAGPAAPVAPGAPRLAAGSIIKASNGPAVYLVSSAGQKHPFATEQVFTACGFNFGMVQNIDATGVVAMPMGPTITHPTHCAAVRQTVWKLPVAAGTVIKPDNGATVYLVTRTGIKLPFTSMQVLTGCGFAPQVIQTLPANTIGAIPNGPALISPVQCQQQRNL
jgi:hypothetical protein